MSDKTPKWTPGSWVALSASGNATDPLQIVASAPPWWGKDSKLIASGFQNINPEANANLLLIAAAPELYAALVNARTRMLRYGEVQSEIDEIDATLAKARGETA